MKKRIFDRTYGYVFAFLYQIPLMLWVSNRIATPLESSVLLLGLAFILILCFCLFYFFVENSLLKIGLFEMKDKLFPLKYFLNKFKIVFFVEILAYFEMFILFGIVWVLFKSSILSILKRSGNGINFWHGLFFGFFMVVIYFLSKEFNKKCFKNSMPIISSGKDDQKINYLRLEEELIGKSISDGLMIFFISLIGFGGLILLDNKVINTWWFLLIFYLIMLLFNLVYVLLKTKKILLLYILLGALPFGFVFPAFLPKHSNVGNTERMVF